MYSFLPSKITFSKPTYHRELIHQHHSWNHVFGEVANCRIFKATHSCLCFFAAGRGGLTRRKNASTQRRRCVMGHNHGTKPRSLALARRVEKTPLTAAILIVRGICRVLKSFMIPFADNMFILRHTFCSHRRKTGEITRIYSPSKATNPHKKINEIFQGSSLRTYWSV